MKRLVDFDDADDVLSAWSAYARVRGHRDADPELYATLEGLLLKMREDRAAEIREAMACAAPSVVLAEYFDDFFEARFGTAGPPAPFSKYRQLVDRTRELAQQTEDRKALVDQAVAFGRSLDIDDEDIRRLVVSTLRHG